MLAMIHIVSKAVIGGYNVIHSSDTNSFFILNDNSPNHAIYVLDYKSIKQVNS